MTRNKFPAASLMWIYIFAGPIAERHLKYQMHECAEAESSLTVLKVKA